MQLAQRLGLATPCEASAAESLFALSFPFSKQLAAAQSIHVHVKVDDTAELPRTSLEADGAQLDYEKEGFVKFKLDGGVNLIFSSIPVAQDELVESECSRRPRPFVDHFGIDLRDEAEDTKATFDAIVCAAQTAGFSLLS